ncbi:DEAD/DEAH box helicase [Intestinibacter sp.]|uniref:DEAD/DEAH box helicase n=1 Tax=Intestinibacter sp. TaxID=1965304 RepID=UPI003F187C4F
MEKSGLDLEKINYSYYKADNTVNIKKYISENSSLILPLIIRAMQGEKDLLLAPTGSGKTYSIIENLKRAGVKAIFVVPNAFNVEQIEKEYDVKGAWGEIAINSVIDKQDLICLTWDKFIQIDKETVKDYIVILDEVHQTLIDTFRMSKINKLYENLENTRGQIHITATPNKLDFSQYDYILEYKQDIQTKYNVFLYDKIDDITILNIVSNSKKFALFKDDKKYLDYIKESIYDKKIEVITSDTRDFSSAYKEIVESSTINDIDGICNTRVLAAGVNIHDQDITDIIIVNEKDIATIKQYVARFRDLKEVNIHILNNYKEESKIYEIEWLVNTEIEEVKDFLNYFNSYKYKNFREEYLDAKPFRLENSNEYYYSKEQKEYKLNEVGIRNKCYTKYYNKANIESFSVLLGEYFSDIKIVPIENPNNKATKLYYEIAKIEKEASLCELEKNKSELVGAIPIITSNNVTSDLKDYLRQNNIDIEKQREVLLELDILNHLKVANISKILNLYTKYVTKDSLTYDMAWSIATRGNRARGKVFAQINYVAYREIAKKHKKHIRYNSPENMLIEQINNYFKIGKSYTKEHLEMFIEAYKNVNPYSQLTLKELREKLNIMFVIKKKRPRSGQLVDYDFLFNEIPTTRPNERPYVYTIVDNTSVDSIVAQNKWSEIDKQILKRKIKDQVKNADLKVKELEFGLDLFA